MTPAPRNHRKSTSFGSHELDWMTLKGEHLAHAQHFNHSVANLISDPPAKRHAYFEHQRRNRWPAP